ncbi:MAG: hypothetical protein KBC96_14070 [Armatimonadetes bacterium]|nr:hypothetical protein [Armatimonadota bacterium]
MDRLIVSASSRKWFGAAPLFDPSDGVVVREAPGSGAGNWVGACSALYDEESDKFYLYFRYRKPRGVEPDRGFLCGIAQSDDGIRFDDIWSATKEQFETSSMERASLFKAPDGIWRLYVSYVDPVDSRWRIDVMEADAPSTFDPATRKKVFTSGDVGLEGVKDPYVVMIGRKHYMLISYAAVTPEGASAGADKLHGTSDAYNTGLVKSYTGLATSNDGLDFEWQGCALDVGTGWDAYESRVTSAVYVPPVFSAFYDGAPNVEGNYEERTGLAVSTDLRSFERVTPHGPAIVSPHASGALRYVDAVQMGSRVFYYYEMARPDGAHDLMVSVVG